MVNGNGPLKISQTQVSYSRLNKHCELIYHISLKKKQKYTKVIKQKPTFSLVCVHLCCVVHARTGVMHNMLASECAYG